MGVDREPLSVDRTRQRASALGLTNVGFVEGDLRKRDFDEPFDAAVGRFVSVYLTDPVEALHRIAGYAQPGGIVAFQEWTAADPVPSLPHAPLWEHTFDLRRETFRRAGTEMGLKPYPTFVGAGLPASTVRGAPRRRRLRLCRIPLLCRVGPGRPPHDAGLLGVATVEEVGIETLRERLRDTGTAAA